MFKCVCAYKTLASQQIYFENWNRILAGTYNLHENSRSYTFGINFKIRQKP